MKQTPKEKKILNNLKPGQITLDGFLGLDKRHLNQIICADRIELDRLDITTKMIADRLQYFTDKAFESYDGSTIIDDKYEVYYNSYRGKLLCPFAHQGVYRKGRITLKNLANGNMIEWTPLNIHMIRDHCFFEGKGSKHRTEPEKIKETIW